MPFTAAPQVSSSARFSLEASPPECLLLPGLDATQRRGRASRTAVSSHAVAQSSGCAPAHPAVPSCRRGQDPFITRHGPGSSARSGALPSREPPRRERRLRERVVRTPRGSSGPRGSISGMCTSSSASAKRVNLNIVWPTSVSAQLLL